jgi:hypothetical protein
MIGSLDTCTEGKPPESVFEALRSLIGTSVQQVSVGSPVLDLCIEFTGGYRLLSFSHHLAVVDGENWEIRHRSGLRLAMRGLTKLVEYTGEPDSPHKMG